MSRKPKLSTFAIVLILSTVIAVSVVFTLATEPPPPEQQPPADLITQFINWILNIWNSFWNWANGK